MKPTLANFKSALKTVTKMRAAQAEYTAKHGMLAWGTTREELRLWDLAERMGADLVRVAEEAAKIADDNDRYHNLRDALSKLEAP